MPTTIDILFNHHLFRFGEWSVAISQLHDIIPGVLVRFKVSCKKCINSFGTSFYPAHRTQSGIGFIDRYNVRNISPGSRILFCPVLISDGLFSINSHYINRKPAFFSLVVIRIGISGLTIFIKVFFNWSGFINLLSGFSSLNLYISETLPALHAPVTVFATKIAQAKIKLDDIILGLALAIGRGLVNRIGQGLTGEVGREHGQPITRKARRLP